MPNNQDYNDLPFAVDDRRKRYYFTIDNIFLDDYGSQLKPFGIAVYAALARFANQDSECWPSHETIARRTGMSKRQVGREIIKLGALKLISITPQYDPETKEHKSNLYTLLEVNPIVTQSIGGMDTQSTPIASVTRRSKPKKKDTHQSNNKKKNGSYRPDEYADIILGYSHELDN